MQLLQPNTAYHHKWGAIAKVNDLSQRHTTYFDLNIREQAARSCGNHSTWLSAELSGSQNTVDLDLLSGPIPRTDLPEMSAPASGRSARDRDEISILSDTSTERGTQQKIK